VSTDFHADYHVTADDPWLRFDKIDALASCHEGQDDGNAAMHREDSSTNVN